ncbi:MAG TPA: MFS transporter, partial [Candidatus Hodarchaeales archaeon]|nr:MFS transporter [Candidatus Hodarchaeales archaeon]
IMCTISILGMLYATDFLLLALLFGLLRTGTHTFPLLSRSFVSSSNPKYQGRMNGWVMTAGNVGGIIGPVFLSVLLVISVSGMIILTSLTSILSMILFVLFMPNELGMSKMSLIEQLRVSAKDIGRFRTQILISLIAGLLNGIFTTLQVPYLNYVLRLTPIEIGLVVGVIQTVGLGFILLGGEMTDRFGPRSVFFYSLTLEIFCGLLVAFIPGLLFFVIGQIGLNGGVSTLITSSTTLMSRKAIKKTFATTFGFTSGFFFLGTSIAPSIASELYLIDPKIPFLLVSAISLIVVPAIYFLFHDDSSSKSIS